MNAALALLERVPHILIFLTALTIVAECAAATGVFDVFGDALVRAGRRRTVLVWPLFMTAAALVTALLSLDTTAVLMTSAAVVVARRLRAPVAMFAFPTLWIANMASLWLPVSNLTNLLARDVMPRPSSSAFLAAAWPVALRTTLVPLAVALAFWGRHLGRRPAPDVRGTEPGEEELRHRTARRAVGVIIALMCVGILVVEPAWAATAGAAGCLAVLGVCTPRALKDVALPWRSILTTTGLFVIVAVVHGSGVLDPLLARLHDAPAWQLTLAGAGLANTTNNLPAYLALEPAAHADTTRLLAVLVGVNVASGLTWWGSVATLLWRERLGRDGVQVSWRHHLAFTGTATVFTTAAALLAL